jgi:hypothetical protein
MAVAKNRIDQDQLKLMLSYEASTGRFFWKVRRGRGAPGKEAGRMNKGNGRWYIVVDGKHFLRSRLAWFYEFGWWPEEVDHINRDRLDDRIGNLRSCTRRQNNLNKDVVVQNKAGIRGVSWHPKYRTWSTRIKEAPGKTLHLGTFACMGRAIKTHRKAERKYYGEFAPQ